MIDTHSDTWHVVRDWAKRELEVALQNLKNPATPHADTQVLRGGIKRLEELLALPEPKKKPLIPASVKYEA